MLAAPVPGRTFLNTLPRFSFSRWIKLSYRATFSHKRLGDKTCHLPAPVAEEGEGEGVVSGFWISNPQSRPRHRLELRASLVTLVRVTLAGFSDHLLCL